MCSRAVRYDDIYRMNKIKSLSFHIMFYRLYRGVAKYIVSGNTFSSFEWLRLYTPPTTGREGETETGGDENDQLGHNQELVPKRGTTSVAWSCVFKHCSFKTTDFKPLKIKQQSYMCAPSNTSYMRAPSLSVWEERAFSFLPTLNDYINTLICIRISILASILKHSDLGLKSE